MINTKRKYLLFLLLLPMLLILAACGGDGGDVVETGCNHVWDDGSVVKAASCTAPGEALYTCTLCGETKTETVPVLEHPWNAGSVIKQADCQHEGVIRYTCTVCDATKDETEPMTEHLWNKGRVSVKPTCVNEGVLLHTCVECLATYGEPIAPSGVHEYSTVPVVTKQPTASSAGAKTYLCKYCLTEGKTETYTYADYQTSVSGLASSIAAFEDSAFGGSTYTTLPTNVYDAPTDSPVANQHPRLLMTKDDLPALRLAWMNPENASTMADLEKSSKEYKSGILGAVTTHTSSDRYGPKGEHNMNESLLNCIVSKALLYQLTGEDHYGYEAILFIKQYMTTLNIVSVNDQCRNYGYTMFVAAIVYDWCYDLMSSTDKTQFISGVEHLLCTGTNKKGAKMEVGFPPSAQGAVTGHGAERQILRDYLSFAVAIYDEAPSWYQYIGGRFYEEFVPVRNAFYESGLTPQGISNYASIRFTSDLWSAWILKTATGKNPYNEANMRRVMYSIFSHVVDGSYEIFDCGDDELKSPMNILKSYALPALMASYLFNDATMHSWAHQLEYSSINQPTYLLLKAGAPKPVADRFEGMDLILYNGGYLSQIIAHSSWRNTAASVYMKIGNRTTANHDHADAGSFQIYYKGFLTGDSGVYDTYGSTHHTQYHQSTVAHDSILFYTAAGTSIGQRRPGESGSYETWQTDKYMTGKTTGVEYRYKDETQVSPSYAYLAGDIAAAYPEGTASEVTRRMLAVYDTGDGSVPMYFFVFDHITSLSDEVRKAFLLHTATEPTINDNTVTVVNGSGKLVLQNLCGGETIIPLGGEDKNYLVDSHQIATGAGEDDKMWGRIEIRTETGNYTDTMLNVMYVTGTENQNVLVAKSITSDTVTGGVIGNTAAVFVTEATRRATAFSFTASGSGDLNYYVSGVAAGTWKISVGGKDCGTATATEDGGLLVFTAPAGKVTLTPAN